MICSTIGEILDYAAERFGTGDVLRYKVKKDTIESKSYRELKSDSERFSRLLDELGEKEGSHIAVTGMTSYSCLAGHLSGDSLQRQGGGASGCVSSCRGYV